MPSCRFPMTTRRVCFFRGITKFKKVKHVLWERVHKHVPCPKIPPSDASTRSVSVTLLYILLL